MAKRVVAALIFNKNKLLLIHHKKLGMWMFVAGHVEKGETNREALKREIKEEVNLDMDIAGRPFYLMKEFYGKNTLHYICKLRKGKIHLKRDEVTDYKWFSKEEIEKANIDQIVKRISLKAFSNL